jgi:exopolysaccharide production protein ExoZ
VSGVLVRLKSIQALRALAAVLVAYCHSIDIQMQFSVSRQQHFHYLENFGAIGVDLFFVISGFIITLVARQYVGAKQGLRFLAKRFIRINPIYYVASLLFEAVLLLKTMILLPADVRFSLFTSGLPASIMSTLLIVPTSGKLLAYSPFLVVGWTLAFEWLFYALFFLLIWSRTPYKAAGLFLQIIVLVVAGSLFRSADYRVVFLRIRSCSSSCSGSRSAGSTCASRRCPGGYRSSAC